MDHFDHGHDAHSHTHNHTHDHTHSHGEAVSGEQAAALLQYMLDHNIHHAAELSDLAKQGMAIIVVSSEIEEIMGVCDSVVTIFEGKKTAQLDITPELQLLHAVASFDQGNGYLSAALELLKKK